MVYTALSIYASTHKEELLALIQKELSQKLRTPVTIQRLDYSLFKNFPYISIQLKDVLIRDSAYSKHKHTSFQCETVGIRINPYFLLLQKISLKHVSLENGSAYLYTDSTGYSNDYLLDNKTDTAKKMEAMGDAPFKRLVVTKFLFTVNNEQNKKQFAFLVHALTIKTNNQSNSISIDIKKDLTVKSMAFSMKEGSFLDQQRLKGKYTVVVHKEKKQLQLPDISFNISNQPFAFKGVFNFNEKQTYSLTVTSNRLKYAFAKKILTRNIAKALTIIDLSAPLNTVTTLDGSLKGGDPLIIAKMAISKTTLKTPLLNFDNASFSGTYTNEVQKGVARRDPNSSIIINNFSGDWNGLPLQSKNMTIINLSSPILTCDFHSNFELSQFAKLLNSNVLQFEAGMGTMDLSYKGPLEKLDTTNTKLTGAIEFSKGILRYKPANIALNNCTGLINISSTDILFSNFSFETANRSRMTMWGRAKNALAIIEENPGKMELTWNVNAPFLNTEGFTSLLTRKKASSSTRKTSSRLGKSINRLDDLLENGTVILHVQAKKLQHKRIEATDLLADIHLSENQWDIKNIFVRHAGGSMKIKGRLDELSGNKTLNLTVVTEKVDAQKLMYAFNDFGQSGINHTNLRGRLSFKSSLSIFLNNTGNMDMKKVSGNIDFSLKDGALLNYAPLEKIKQHIFKDRDFSTIRFAEIADNLIIANGMVNMNRINIESTALSLYLKGYYGFAGKTDMSIQVPLRNLKKRDSTYKIANTSNSGGGGMSIFLRAKSHEDGSITLRYDPLGRFRKPEKKNLKEKE